MTWSGGIPKYREARKRAMRLKGRRGGIVPKQITGPDSDQSVDQAQDMESDYSKLRKQPDAWPLNRQYSSGRGRGRDFAGVNSQGDGSGPNNQSGGGQGGGQQGGGGQKGAGSSSNVAYMHFPAEGGRRFSESEGGNSTMYSIPTYPASLAVNGGFAGAYGGGALPYPVSAGLQQTGTDLGTLILSNSVADNGREIGRSQNETFHAISDLGFNLFRDDKVTALSAARDSRDNAVGLVTVGKDAEIRSLEVQFALQDQIKDENNRTRDLVLQLDRERTQREFERTERKVERLEAQRDNDRVVAMLGAILGKLG